MMKIWRMEETLGFRALCDCGSERHSGCDSEAEERHNHSFNRTESPEPTPGNLRAQAN